MTGAAQRVAQGIALAGVLALLGLLVWKVAFDREGGVASELAAGTPVVVPEFALERLDRTGTLSLGDLAGKPLVVNFWASWCVPCKDEAPVLQETFARYKARGLVVLGVNAQDFRADARRFIRRFGLAYPNVYDGKGSTLGKWGVTGFPETFFVDRNGDVVGERIQGGIDLEQNVEAYERGIELALGSSG